MKLQEQIIKEFVKEVLNEEGYWRQSGSKKIDASEPIKKVKKAYNRFKSLISGHSGADKIAEEWFEEQELHLDQELPKDFKNVVLKFVRTKYPIVHKLSRSKNEDKISEKMQLVLNKKFKKNIIAYGKNMNKDFYD